VGTPGVGELRIFPQASKPTSAAAAPAYLRNLRLDKGDFLEDFIDE